MKCLEKYPRSEWLQRRVGGAVSGQGRPQDEYIDSAPLSYDSMILDTSRAMISRMYYAARMIVISVKRPSFKKMKIEGAEVEGCVRSFGEL